MLMLIGPRTVIFDDPLRPGLDLKGRRWPDEAFAISRDALSESRHGCDRLARQLVGQLLQVES